ncbi:MAG: 4-phosphoerythronate dehydrogenase PdxB [Pseudomonadales bacterium]
MKIIADENIPLVNEVFGEFGVVETCAGRAITPHHVRDAEVLLVRSITKVDKQLLAGSKVRFVGTCTIGTDHVDQAWLRANDIAFSAAPGCNANAVVDYVLSALVTLSRQQHFDLRERCVGIVGVGNVGGRLKSRLEALGVRCLCTDPLNDDLELPGRVHLDELIAESDVITLHTPLEKNGEHPTWHLFNALNLPLLRPGTILVNSARGSVIDNQALLELLNERDDVTAVLDVWEGEPDISLPLLARVAVATPHIAGYSLDGKVNGTLLVYEAMCQHFNLPRKLDVSTLLPEGDALEAAAALGDHFEKACQMVTQAYDVLRDDHAFRQVMTENNKNRAGSFDALRKNYPVRREFGVTKVRLSERDESLEGALSAFGFKCEADC